MRRLFMPIIVAAFAVGCGERAISATSPLAPRAASHDDATPPPPPLSGDGSLDFSAVESTDGSSATDCSISASIPMTFKYFANNTNNNAFLHINFGDGSDVRVHQTSTTLAARGTITTPDFTFTIAQALSGDIGAPKGVAPRSVTVQLTGTLTVGDATCTANATLTAVLGSQIIP